MYSYQVATKENMHKPTLNLVKILISGTICFLLYPSAEGLRTGFIEYVCYKVLLANHSVL